MATYSGIKKIKIGSDVFNLYDSGNSGGTVTKLTAGTGLKVGTNTSGGDITTTGTINHINSITAQNTQAVYPIKIDAQGHISAYGNAVTIVNSRQAEQNEGTTLSVVNTGDIYTWNHKQDKLTNPVTGTGNSGYLVKWNGNTSITNGPQLGNSTTTFLRNDGSWATPVDTKVSLTNISSNNVYPLLFGPNSITSGSAYGINYNNNIVVNPANGIIKATKGIFNELIATNANINELTATNAKVVGILDVTKGELHTSKWTNANISNIGGSFYISPTVSTTIASNETPMNFMVTGSSSSRTIVVSGGSFITNSVRACNGYVETNDTIYNSEKTYYYISNNAYVEFTGNSFVSSTTYYEFIQEEYSVSWEVGSKVMITGTIRNGNSMDYPLGTCIGVLSAPLTQTGFTINGVDSPALESIINELNTTNFTSYDIQISMYEIGPSTVSKPVGIMMTSYGLDNSTYIDIYGGVNVKKDGKTDPNVRLGYLGNLDPYNYFLSQDTEVNLRKSYYIYSNNVYTKVAEPNGNPSAQQYYEAIQPVGWGIYTDNGFFKGAVIADSGKIGNFTITNDLYSGQLGQENSVWVSAGTNNAAAIGGINRNISGWAFTAGNKFGVTKDGDLYASNVTINGSITITGDDSNIYTRDEVDDITETSIKDIEKIINIEDWLQEYGSYILTEDTISILHKNYFADEYRLSEDTTIYEYNLVENPMGNPQTQNWYELNGDEYIATSDTIVQEDKQYYTRTNNKTYYTRSGESEPYEYTPVSPESDDSPTSNGWYEIVKVQVIPTVNPSLQEYYQLNSQTWSVTLDTIVDVDKQYFERFERDDEPGSYYYVPINADIHDNPSEKQWYELTNDTYIQSPDTTLENHKLYFSQIIQDNIISYKPIMEHIPNPSILNLYELDNVKYSISNYIASHVKLKNNAIIIQADNTKACVHISLNGIVLKDNDGTPVASFAKDIILGNKSEMHLELSPGNSNTLPELGFYDGNTKVAYVNSNTLNINQGEIKEKLRIGQFEWRTQGANRISLIYAPISS